MQILETTGLLSLLDGQVEHLLEATPARRLMLVGRFTRMLSSEPRVAAALADMRIDALAAVSEMVVAANAVRLRIAAAWMTAEAEMLETLNSELDEDVLNAMGPIRSFAEPLQKEFAVDDWAQVAQELKRVLDRGQHYGKYAADHCGEREGIVPSHVTKLCRELAELAPPTNQVARGLSRAPRTDAWFAYDRLVRTAARANPAPPSSDLLSYVRYGKDLVFAEAIDDESVGLRSKSALEVDHAARDVADDLRLLREELRLRLLQARARIALVRRYAARAEAFDATRLRAAAEQDSKNAERTLTLDLARYLFDAGLSPLIDTTIGGLRPDVLEMGAENLFYVEAKQYHEGRSPRGVIRDAYRQVWSTWGRLRNQHHVPEAFLVVFRRGGPRAELPPVLRHGDLRLYSVLADLAEDAGSREKDQPIVFDEAELLPSDTQ